MTTPPARPLYARDLKDVVTSLPPNARLLGLDLGEKTIGLALSDVMRVIASPLETLTRTRQGADIQRLKDVAGRHDVGALVLGLPRNMDGTEGPRAQSTRAFARAIASAWGIPLALWDERMSTMAVTRTLLEADTSRARRAVLIDKLAAAYILQGALDSLRPR